jgi:hypothetical protein
MGPVGLASPCRSGRRTGPGDWRQTSAGRPWPAALLATPSPLALAAGSLPPAVRDLVQAAYEERLEREEVAALLFAVTQPVKPLRVHPENELTDAHPHSQASQRRPRRARSGPFEAAPDLSRPVGFDRLCLDQGRSQTRRPRRCRKATSGGGNLILGLASRNPSRGTPPHYTFRRPARFPVEELHRGPAAATPRSSPGSVAPCSAERQGQQPGRPATLYPEEPSAARVGRSAGFAARTLPPPSRRERVPIDRLDAASGHDAIRPYRVLKQQGSGAWPPRPAETPLTLPRTERWTGPPPEPVHRGVRPPPIRAHPNASGRSTTCRGRPGVPGSPAAGHPNCDTATTSPSANSFFRRALSCLAWGAPGRPGAVFPGPLLPPVKPQAYFFRPSRRKPVRSLAKKALRHYNKA